MIPLVEEPADDFKNLHVYERCHFCKQPTSTWYERMNQPVCRACAKVHKVSEVPPCTPAFKPKKRGWFASCDKKQPPINEEDTLGYMQGRGAA